jgi:hypothetical protein
LDFIACAGVNFGFSYASQGGINAPGFSTRVSENTSRQRQGRMNIQAGNHHRLKAAANPTAARKCTPVLLLHLLSGFPPYRGSHLKTNTCKNFSSTNDAGSAQRNYRREISYLPHELFPPGKLILFFVHPSRPIWTTCFNFNAEAHCNRIAAKIQNGLF